MQRPTKVQPDVRPRIVDLIAEGLSLAVARPWLILIPILVDLFIWIGVKIEPRALMNSLVNLVEDASIENSDEVITSLQDFASANLSQLVAIFVPSMLTGVARGDLYEIVDQRIWSPGSSGMVVLVGFGLLMAGTLLSMVYTVPIANAILGRRQAPAALIGSIARAWGRLILFLLLVVGTVFALAIPIALMSAIFAGLLPLFTALLTLAGLAALFYFYFVFDAIVVANVGPITAIRYSVAVVSRNLRGAIGLILATLLLTTGLPAMVEGFLDDLPGLVLAVLLQAFIATGATAASMFFFVDRLRQWRPELVQLPHTAPAFDLTRQGESRS
jgi:hypothetical protein